MQPYAVIVALVQEKLLKLGNAVVPEVVGDMLTNNPPPATYDPEAGTSLVAVYAVVAALNVALLLYSAQ
jgi:hypothetical protein